MTIVTASDAPKTYMAECTEPKCESFGIGHEEDESERDDPSFLHYAASYGDYYGEESYEVRIGRDPAPEAVWELFIQVNGDMWTPDEATAFAEVLTKAAAQCKELNA